MGAHESFQHAAAWAARRFVATATMPPGADVSVIDLIAVRVSARVGRFQAEHLRFSTVREARSQSRAATLSRRHKAGAGLLPRLLRC